MEDKNSPPSFLKQLGEKQLSKFEERITSLPPILDSIQKEVVYRERKYRVAVKVFRPYSQTWFEIYSGEFMPVNDALKMQQVYTQEAGARKVSGVLVKVEETEPNVVDLDFAISASVEHELLLGVMHEAGIPQDRIRKIGKDGIKIPTIPGVNTRAVLLTTTSNIGGLGEDRYAAIVENSPENPLIRQRLVDRMNEIAQVAHKVLPAIAKDITRDTEIGNSFVFRITNWQGKLLKHNTTPTPAVE